MTEIESDNNIFTNLSEDLILNIFIKLIDDPRHWSNLACVCSKFSFMIRTICWKNKCYQTIPAVIADLVNIPANINNDSDEMTSSLPPGGWSSMFKLAVCCPGLGHSGVLLGHSDFGLERDLGPDENYNLSVANPSCSRTSDKGSENQVKVEVDLNESRNVNVDVNECAWSLYDDLYLDTVYNDASKVNCEENDGESDVVTERGEFVVVKKRKVCRSLKAHLASEVWNFSREQGNKLLASRFRGDCLYICDWPGCVHTEEKRNYMLFRGVFKNFKKSRVWRTIKDGNKSKIGLNCAFCPSNDVWDLHSAFCLRPAYGFHDDGEPVVRAYVCENGHVSGAWTDWPLYT